MAPPPSGPPPRQAIDTNDTVVLRTATARSAVIVGRQRAGPRADAAEDLSLMRTENSSERIGVALMVPRST